MFNPDDVAEQVLREIDRFGSRVRHNDGPDVPSENLRRALEQTPVPSRESLAQAIREGYAASLLTEEGRPCRPRLTYAPPTREVTPFDLLFGEPVALNRMELRRLAPVLGRGHLLWRADPAPQIVGIAPWSGAPSNLTLQVQGAGALDVLWCSFRLLTLRGDEVRTFSGSALPDLSAAVALVAGLVPEHQIAVSMLQAALDTVAQGGHGGSVWLVEDPAAASGLTVKGPIVPGERLVDRLPQIAERMLWLDAVGSLAAADGAVLMDFEGRLHGFGTFVEVGKPEPVSVRHHDGTVTSVSSETLGGGRHQAAVAFCRRCAPAAAFVASSDGHLSMVHCRRAAEGVFFTSIGALGFSR